MGRDARGGYPAGDKPISELRPPTGLMRRPDTDTAWRKALTQVEHLELISQQLRSQGDVEQVVLSEEGVSQVAPLAGELSLIAYNLRAALSAAGAGKRRT